MRLLMIIGMLAALPWGAALAAPTWQTISSEPGKRIEIDRTNLKREGSVVQALGRVVLEKELIDGRSGAPYRVIEATTRYDCATRSANTIKRTLKKNENEIVREEEPKGIELPVRTGTLDDKVLREVCRPPKDTQVELAKKANEAAGELKAANDALLKKELAKAEKPKSIKVAEAAKVIENTQRDLNIALINELALIFHRLGIDTREVLDAAGTKWNFLPFSPGLVGGHCIGVDPYYLTHKAQKLGYHPEVILAGRRINDGMGKFIAEQTVKQLVRNGHPVKDCPVIVLGLTFKEDCPDLRNSRVIDVIRELESYGANVVVHDPVADGAEARHEYGVTLVS